jgi:hypothetical protein
LTLHITNGDGAAEILRQAVQGEILPWRDVLHEGPVRAGLSIDDLSRERAAFIAGCGWGELAAVDKDFRARDAVLKGAGSHVEVVLWFEHDLYDQLQLIQLLAWFAANPHPRLSLVCEAEYLGRMQPRRAAELFARRTPVAAAHLEEAQQAWIAFGASDPQRLAAFRPRTLRFLGAALRRQLEEFPWIGDGLSRTERAVLEALRPGALEFAEIFRRVREDPAFLGDSVLAWHLQRMRQEGLVDEKAGRWTRAGARKSRVPRWLGGVRVDDDSPWRWDPSRGAVRALR